MKYLVFQGKVIILFQGQDGFWRDDRQVIYAYADDSFSVDKMVMSGVGVLLLPENSPLNIAFKGHYYVYSSPVFNIFNTRSEAEQYLKNSLKIVTKNKWYNFIPNIFYRLTNISVVDSAKQGD